MAGRKKRPSVASCSDRKRKSQRTRYLTCAPPAGPKTTGDEPLPADDELLPDDDEPLPAGAEPLPGDDLILIAKEGIVERQNRTRVVLLCAPLTPMPKLSAPPFEAMRAPRPNREVGHAEVQEL